MNELSYWNGELVTDAEPSISVLDVGVVQGVAVPEQMRTFGGKLFQLDEHLQRLQRSLHIIGINDLDMEALKSAAEVVASHNHSLLQPGDDLGLTLIVTPGSYTAATHADDPGPTVGMYTTPLPFHRWVKKYSTGETLIISSVRQVPSSCWPAELKCRSRMHYFLADREAQSRKPGARALLLDQDGWVAEASTASVILYREEEGFVVPPADNVLPGVSMSVLQTLAEEMEIAFVRRNISVDDVRSADEVFLCSTSPCVLPVVAVDDSQPGDGLPGEIYQQMIDAWGSLVGLDIVAQASAFAAR
ncbi:MAG: aminotransferase class IV [Fuerstiella sp.]|nr:aminotransferase class IV [Fuerstiella sp.]